jgi:hypothetical protein
VGRSIICNPKSRHKLHIHKLFAQKINVGPTTIQGQTGDSMVYLATKNVMALIGPFLREQVRKYSTNRFVGLAFFSTLDNSQLHPPDPTSIHDDYPSQGHLKARQSPNTQ